MKLIEFSGDSENPVGKKSIFGVMQCLLPRGMDTQY